MATRGVEMTLTFTAWDAGSSAPKTGDSGNFTLRWIKDGTASAPTNSAAELDATNCPGIYTLVITSTEADANLGCLAGKSSTADVSIIPTLIQFERLPNAAPGAVSGVSLTSSVDDVEAKIDTLDTVADGIATTLGTSGAGLTDVGGFSTAALGEINAEADAALADYDAPTKSEMDDAFTAVKGATFDTSTDSLEAIRNRGDSSWLTATGFSTHSAADVWAVGTRTLSAFGFSVDVTTIESGDATTALETAATASLNSYDRPTKSEMDDAFTAVKGATFDTSTDSLEAIRNRGDSSWATATGFSTFDPSSDTVANVTTVGSVSALAEAAVVDVWSTYALTESYAAEGAAATPAELLYLAQAMDGEKAISSTTVTLKKLDQSTTAATYTLDSSTSPTSITRAT